MTTSVVHLLPDARPSSLPNGLVRINGRVVRVRGDFSRVDIRDAWPFRALSKEEALEETQGPLIIRSVWVRGVYPLWSQVDAIGRLRRTEMPRDGRFRGRRQSLIYLQPISDTSVRIVDEYPFLTAMRKSIRLRVSQFTQPRVRAYLFAFLCADATLLSKELRDAFASLGVAHLLALSGLHLALFWGSALFVLRVFSRFFVRRWDADRVALALSLPLVLVFVLLMGAHASVLRASSFVALLVSGRLLFVQIEGLIALAFVAFFVPLTTAMDAADLGFTLSVCATSGLLTMAREQKRILAVAWEASWRPFIATLPLVMLYFGSFPWVSIGLNLVAGIVFSPLMLLLFGAFVEARFDGVYIADFAERVFLSIDTALLSLAGYPGVNVQIRQLGQIEFVLASAFSLFLLVPGKISFRLVASGVIGLIWVTSVLGFFPESFRDKNTDIATAAEVRMLDIGQGDALLIHDGTYTLLFDAGPGDKAHASRLKRTLDRQIRTVDALFISHLHPDHFGGLLSISHLRVKRAFINRMPQPGHPLARWLSRHAEQIIVASDDNCRPVRFGRVEVDMIHPCGEHEMDENENNNSMVHLIDLHGASIFVGGDIEIDVEALLVPKLQRWLRRKERKRFDLYKVSHHGSRTSSSRSFLATLRPRVAFVSAGQGNHFGHPHSQTLSRLETVGAAVFSTDQLGELQLQFNRRDLSVRNAERRLYFENARDEQVAMGPQ